VNNWRETCEYMDKLIRANMPPLLKAHYLLRVLLPRLIAQIGIKECGEIMGGMFADGLCASTGTCSVCKKVKADGDDGLCCKCRAEIDQVCAEAGYEH
jgi:hypothetical protein